MDAATLDFHTPPSAFGYMLSALRPSHGWQAAQGFPALRLRWHGYDPAGTDAAQRALLREVPALLRPQVTGFRLAMALLTHHHWPLPVWGALQVRNRLRLHAPAPRPGRLETVADAWRVLDKGLEVDLHTRLFDAQDRCCWESSVTFYYRGRYGEPRAQGDARGAPPQPGSTDAAAALASWQIPSGDRWLWGAATGDYNGIHQWGWYARRFGFAGAFSHPQRIAAQCLNEMTPATAGARELDLWLRGPLYYGMPAQLHGRRHGDEVHFALHAAGDARPALLGCWRET